MLDERQSAWFKFTLRETGEGGVELPKLSRLLDHLSSTFYAIAREKAGLGPARPGPKTPKEEALAAIRLVRVEPGSATIELAPPPPSAQVRLIEADEPTPDDVAFDFFEEARLIGSGEAVQPGRWELRRRVRAVVDTAAEIGATAELEFRPLLPRPNQPVDAVLRTTFHTRGIPEEKPLERQVRTRRMTGHAYMVDVEPGRQRLRVKTHDGRDATVEVAEQLIPQISKALDQVVEVEIEEEIEGDVSVARKVLGLTVLPSSGPGSDKPPKSVDDLRREQGIPRKAPDYVALASAVWQTAHDVEEFEKYIHEIREAARS